MRPGDLLVTLIGGVPYGVLDRVLQPSAQVLPKLEALGIEDKAALPVGERIGQLRRDLLTGVAVEGLALAPFGLYTVYWAIQPPLLRRVIEPSPLPRLPIPNPPL
jgi:hypothetical protein